MDTKFTKYVLVKKNIVDACENKIYSCNISISKQKEYLQRLHNELYSLEIPHEGSFVMFRQSQEMKSALYGSIEEEREELHILEDTLVSLKNELKSAMLEYEKAKYLESVEIDKILKAQKIAEAKEIDEISLILYNNRKIT